MKASLSKRLIVVLSPGRSGTSLLMMALKAMGMCLSANLIPGNYANPEGHFEDEDIVEEHKNIFQLLQKRSFMPLPDGWLENKEALDLARKKLAAVVQQHIDGASTIWGFKDPRINVFLPFWFKIFNAHRFSPVFILAVRKPQNTVSSHSKQYDVKPELAELVYLIRTLDALYHTAADCFIVHYEDWFTRPFEVGQGLLTYTGLDQYFIGNMEDALKDVIKPNLNRSRNVDYEIKNEYVLKLYDVLKDCRGADFDRERLMAVVMECRKAMDGFKGWYLEAQKCIGQANILRDAMRECQSKIKQQQERIDTLQKAQAGLKNKLEGQASAPTESNPEKSIRSKAIRIQTVPDLDRLIELAMTTVRELACYRVTLSDRFGQDFGTASPMHQNHNRAVESVSAGHGPGLVFVLGAPRSGVGVVGRCLDALGLRSLDRFNDQGERNVERPGNDLVDLVHGLVFPNQSEFDTLPRNWLASPAASQAKDIIIAALDRTEGENSSEQTLYLADVRVGRAFALWEQAAAASGRFIRVLHVFRHPWETVGSLTQHSGLDPHQAGFVWLSCIRAIQANCQAHKHALVSIDQILADPLSTLIGLNHQLGMSLAVTDQVERLLSIIQPGLKQFQVAAMDLPDKAVFTLHQQVYDELRSIQSLVPLC